MTTPPTKHEDVHAALIAIQRNLPVVAKDSEVTIEGRANYSYRFADLRSVQEAVLPLLHANGCVFICTSRLVEGGTGYELVATIRHIDSGTEVVATLPLRGNAMQDIGSSITYGRRYALSLMTGLLTYEDPDARGRAANPTRTWDGDSTAVLLNRLDQAASQAGVTYEQATARFRERQGLSLDDLDRLEPWVVLPLVEAVEKRANEVIAEQAAADTAPEANG